MRLSIFTESGGEEGAGGGAGCFCRVRLAIGGKYNGTSRFLRRGHRSIGNPSVLKGRRVAPLAWRAFSAKAVRRTTGMGAGPNRVPCHASLRGEDEKQEIRRMRRRGRAASDGTRNAAVLAANPFYRGANRLHTLDNAVVKARRSNMARRIVIAPRVDTIIRRVKIIYRRADTIIRRVKIIYRRADTTIRRVNIIYRRVNTTIRRVNMIYRRVNIIYRRVDTTIRRVNIVYRRVKMIYRRVNIVDRRAAGAVRRSRHAPRAGHSEASSALRPWPDRLLCGVGARRRVDRVVRLHAARPRPPGAGHIETQCRTKAGLCNFT